MSSTLRALCLGDVVGRVGRHLLKEQLTRLRERLNADLVVVNAENAAGGLGPTPDTVREILGYGADLITLGDHTWHKKDIGAFLEDFKEKCVRPANYPIGAAGRGFTIWRGKQGVQVGILNLIGRVFTNSILDCPFRSADAHLKGELAGCKIIIVDMHAEATSEKIALARYLDGRVSLVFGTHTHVQTADEQIFPGGTAFISDLGMCGSNSGVIGMRKETAIKRFLSGLPIGYEVADQGPAILSGVLCEIDCTSGRALKIERVREVSPN